MAGPRPHHQGCERAKLHVCKCSQCGGALHGWEGWLEFVDDSGDEKVEEREEQIRKRAESEWSRYQRDGKKRRRRQLLQACIDKARLDIVARLRSLKRSIPKPSEEGSQAPSETDLREVIPQPRVARPDESPPQRPPTPEPERSTTGQVPHPIQTQIEGLAGALGTQTWIDLQDDPDIELDKATRKELAASHFWCDLFVGLARALDEFHEALSEIPDSIKERVKDFVRHSEMRGIRRRVTDYLIGSIVDKAWDALMTAMSTHTPFLALLNSQELARDLRILAIITCPDPSNHKEVREYALKPLGDEFVEFVTTQTKDRLKEVFPEWVEQQIS